jgi:hypothetical protein
MMSACSIKTAIGVRHGVLEDGWQAGQGRDEGRAGSWLAEAAAGWASRRSSSTGLQVETVADQDRSRDVPDEGEQGRVLVTELFAQLGVLGTCAFIAYVSLMLGAIATFIVGIVVVVSDERKAEKDHECYRREVKARASEHV